MLKIRLLQMGRTNRLVYRLVVADTRSPRDGKYLEMVGHYDPHRKSPHHVCVVEDRIRYWLDQGAKLTEKAHHLVLSAAPELISTMQKSQSAKKLEKAKKKKEKRKKKE